MVMERPPDIGFLYSLCPVEETGTYFGDGSHIIYVNGSYKDDSDPVGRLMHDFRCLSLPTSLPNPQITGS